jgi:hypothetical protein
MKKTILFIVFVMLVLTTGARVELTYMNCKFNEGWHKKGSKREDVKTTAQCPLIYIESL